MYKLLALSVLLLTTMALRTQENHQLQNGHLLDESLCTKKGGFVCGRISKDCCVIGCEKRFLSENCQQDKYLNLEEQPAAATTDSSKKPETPAANTTTTTKPTTTTTTTTTSSNSTKPASSSTTTTATTSPSSTSTKKL